MQYAHCASGFSCMPWRKNQSGSFQMAPLLLLNAEADGYHWKIYVHSGCNSCQNIYHSGIQFSGISLSRNREAGIKSHFLGDQSICFFSIYSSSPSNKFQETCLCSRCSLGAKKFHMRTEHVFQILQIHYQFHGSKVWLFYLR